MKKRSVLVALCVVAFAGAARAQVPLPQPSPSVQGWPGCSDLMVVNNQVVPGNHSDNCAENGGYGGCNGIIGDVLPDGTQIAGTQQMCSGANIMGCDRVYETTFEQMQVFTQCYCATKPVNIIVNNVPTTVPAGTGIQTLWQNVQVCSQSLPTGSACDPLGCHWNIPFWSGCQTAGCCEPATAMHSNLYDCKPLVCGDGTRQPWEECDDGNRVDGDGCNANCMEQEECANLVDDDVDMKIDCRDPECQCIPLGVHGCPSRVIFSDTRPDELRAHGTIDGSCPAGLTTQEVCVALLDAGGLIFKKCVGAGGIMQNGTQFKYQDAGARFLGGVGKMKFAGKPSKGTCDWSFDAFGDLSGADTPDMTIEITVGGVTALSHSATWLQRHFGWATRR